MIHNFAEWASQPAPELTQDPLFSEDETDEYFLCSDTMESVPCINISDPEDQGPLTLIPKAFSAKAKEGIVHQDKILYPHSAMKPISVQKFKTKGTVSSVKEPRRPDSQKKIQGVQHPPIANDSVTVSPSDLAIPVSNRIATVSAEDKETSSYWFAKGKEAAKQDHTTPSPEKRPKFTERVQALSLIHI